MNRQEYQYSPIDGIKNNQMSFSQNQNNQLANTKYDNYQPNVPQFDYAYIQENYRKLRMQQRQQLSQLRMPDQMKHKFFGFQKGQTFKAYYPQLAIFNHPFKGKIVMTKEDLAKQLKKQAEFIQNQQNINNQFIPQKTSHNIVRNDDKLKAKSSNMRKKASQQIRKTNNLGQDQLKNTPQKINKNKQSQLQKRQSQLKKQQSYLQRRQSQLLTRQQKNCEQTLSKIPTIGQQPFIRKDLAYKNGQKSKKMYNKPFANQLQSKYIQTNNKEGKYQIQGKNRVQTRYQDKDKSMSVISNIKSNSNHDVQSNQSLNNAFFLK